MRGEHLFEAITNIDERFVEEANPANMKPRRKKPVLLYRYGAIAAMLVFAIGISALVLDRGVLSSKSEEAAPAAEESAAFMLKPAAEEEEYEECVVEEAAEAPAEEPAEAAAPAEAAIVTAETAGGEMPAADGVMEEPAMESAIMEESAEEETSGVRAMPQSEILYQGSAYAPMQELLEGLPKGCTEAGTVSGEADSLWYSEDAALHGASVWLPEDSEDGFYIEYEGGYVLYQRVP